MSSSALRRGFWVLLCGALIVTLGMGVRQSLGVFLRPISMELEVGRQVFGLALAIQTLIFGLAQPFAGIAADRWGAGRVVALGAVVYAAGLALAGASSSATDLYVSLGLLVGLAMSGTTMVVVLGAVGRAVPEHLRSTAFGIVMAGGSFGQFAVVPGAQALLGALDWRWALLALAALVLAVALLAPGVAGRPAARAGQSLAQALREARGHSGYWLLNAGFFVCGFHVSFISTHLPAYLQDASLPVWVGAWSLAAIGLFNIFGSYLFGAWGDRYRKKWLLSGLYFARAVAITVFLALPPTPTTALAFAAVMGFLWLGTVPLTSGIVAQVFGTQHLSMLFGIVFLSHQVGGFFGAWLGGYAFDALGSYQSVWLVSIALGLIAAVLHLPIADRPAPRLAFGGAA
jgi:predicted MFS family arabinose efflux permease